MKDTQLIDLFQRARSSKKWAVIEGVQALKHACRFGAEFEQIITCDITLLEKLLVELAPDISQKVLNQAEVVSEPVLQKLSPLAVRTKVITLAKRKGYTFSAIDPGKPIVFLENPRDLENIGAVIRVSAAADVAAVIASGAVDMWHPAVIRGAAGLQYAVPVFNASLSSIPLKRAVLALDPEGDDLGDISLPKNAVFIFGTERHGVSPAALKRADATVRLPMKAGVSSLNLATSVAATLYQL